MRACLCLLVSLGTISVLAAQEKISFGLELFPNTNTTLVNDDLWAELEESKFSYAANLLIEVYQGSRLAIQSGLGFTVKRYQINRSQFQWPSQVGPGFTFDPTINPGEELDELHLTYQVTFLQVPIHLHYSIARGSKFYLAFGIAPILYMTNGYTVKKTIQGDTTTESNSYPDDNYKTIHLGLNGGIGFRGSISDKTTFQVEPRVMVMPLGIYKNAALNRNFLSGGIALAIMFD